MNNYIEYNDKVAFHPGYYIDELLDESGLTKEDFAIKLDISPEDLSMLIRGERGLSVDVAMKLSEMFGSSADYWLNLQNAFDSLVAEFKMEKKS